MATAQKKRYQNTTVRMPQQVYERAKVAIRHTQQSSFNEFVVQAIEEKVRRLNEAEIDAAFAQMADDPEYQRAAIAMSREFEKSDWEAFGSPPTSTKPVKGSNARTAKASSR
jgi:hypothetical protein